MPIQPPTSPQPTRGQRFRRAVRRGFNAIVLFVNVVASLLLVFTAYSGLIAPERWTYAGISVMAFSFLMPGCLLLFILDLIWWRRTAMVMGLAMIACAGPIHDFMPLNLPRWGMTEQQRERSFTLMTYNTAKFIEQTSDSVDHSRQLAFILDKSPDIVCVQESNFLAPNAENHIQQQQLDSLHSMYPYVYTQGEDLALFSKFPAQPINIDYPKSEYGSGDIGAWRLDVHGRVVNIFSVHLRSLGLTNEDKDDYQEIVKLDNVSRGEIRELRHAVVPKISKACIDRAKQVQLLQKYLGKYGGKTAIVCGDFNDPVGCYGLHLLCSQSHMRQAYAEAAFGPTFTFNANDLYFRIDHVLYRGELTPYRIRIPHFHASDHFPIITTFIL